MSNTTEEAVINEAEAVNQETTTSAESNVTEEAKELTPEEKLSELQAKRMGTFKVELTHSDATYFRNTLDKSVYKGPQQAYLLIISKLEISQICEALKGASRESRHSVDITAATIESISYFLNNREGTGADSAQKLFAASMVLRPAIGEINRMDSEIEDLRKSLESSK